MKFLQILIHTLLVLLIMTFLLLLFCTKPVTTYQLDESKHFKSWKSEISKLKFKANDDSLQEWNIGWAKVNITPDHPTPMAGYGNRKGKPFEGIHDSLYVRCIYLSNGTNEVALVSVDMLIIPPTVYNILKAKSSLDVSKIYLSATHSHNSLGGWYNTLAGKVFAGNYIPEVEIKISNAILNSIAEAKSKASTGKITFTKDIDREDIRNRLNDNENTIDAIIRSLEFKKDNGQKAVMVTYAAHSTVLNSATMKLSRDYPGILVDSLENKEFNFAEFMAGAVGSMGPIEKGIDDFDEVQNQGIGVKNHLIKKNDFEEQLNPGTLICKEIKLPMPAPAPRIAANLALRPWVFYWLFGQEAVFVKALKIGNLLLVGMPCDFSGELMKSLDDYASSKGLALLITSFNGGYVGYITADEHYNENYYETRTMNWYGPNNGDYFSEVIRNLIDKATK